MRTPASKWPISSRPSKWTDSSKWTDAEKEHLRALVVEYTVNVKVQWAKIGPLLPSGRSLNGARCTWGRMCKAEAKGAHA